MNVACTPKKHYPCSSNNGQRSFIRNKCPSDGVCHRFPYNSPSSCCSEDIVSTPNNNNNRRRSSTISSDTVNSSSRCGSPFYPSNPFSKYTQNGYSNSLMSDVYAYQRCSEHNFCNSDSSSYTHPPYSRLNYFKDRIKSSSGGNLLCNEIHSKYVQRSAGSDTSTTISAKDYSDRPCSRDCDSRPSTSSARPLQIGPQQVFPGHAPSIMTLPVYHCPSPPPIQHQFFPNSQFFLSSPYVLYQSPFTPLFMTHHADSHCSSFNFPPLHSPSVSKPMGNISSSVDGGVTNTFSGKCSSSPENSFKIVSEYVCPSSNYSKTCPSVACKESDTHSASSHLLFSSQTNNDNSSLATAAAHSVSDIPNSNGYNIKRYSGLTLMDPLCNLSRLTRLPDDRCALLPISPPFTPASPLFDSPQLSPSSAVIHTEQSFMHKW